MDGHDGAPKFTDPEVYLVSLYYTITTITTVGYGDISGYNNLERAFAILLMLIGVTCFSYLNGALAAIFQSLDSSNAELQSRMNLVHKISRQYKFNKELKTRVIKQMGYCQVNEHEEVLSLLDTLPPKLRKEVTLVIYKQMQNHIDFLREPSVMIDDTKAAKSDTFLAWVCPLLVPRHFEENEVIFNRDDACEMIYFHTKGRISYILMTD